VSLPAPVGGVGEVGDFLFGTLDVLFPPSELLVGEVGEKLAK
jgi:hypothetical protein